MLDTISVYGTRALDLLGLVPNWLVGTVILGIAVALALLAFRMVVAAVRRALGTRHPRLRTLLAGGDGPLRLALVVLALSIALPIAPIPAGVADAMARGLRVAFIALMGWLAIVGAQIGTQIYLRQFHLDAEDNLLARKHVTQVKVLKRAADVLIVTITLGAALMSFEEVRQYGVSLFASAGVAGLAVGLAARPLLSNLIAGVQIAVAQPIRLDDVVLIEGEYGTIEEITTAFVVVKLWDWRRMVVPLSYFIEKPFQNWTRETSALIGSVYLYLDYAAPIERLREQLGEIARGSPLFDGRVLALQVTDAKERTIEVRALVSARSAPSAWDLRCEVREKLITFLRQHHPDALPRTRQDITRMDGERDQWPLESVLADQRRQ